MNVVGALIHKMAQNLILLEVTQTKSCEVHTKVNCKPSVNPVLQGSYKLF